MLVLLFFLFISVAVHFAAVVMVPVVVLSAVVVLVFTVIYAVRVVGQSSR